MLNPGETAHFTVACTCVGEHQNLRVVMGRKGIPKEIVGNASCWYNQWFFLREQLEDPDERILRKWAERYVRWSPLRWSEPYIQGSFNRFARYCHLERAEHIRNTAGRKTCVSIGLGDMQLPAAKLPRYLQEKTIVLLDLGNANHYTPKRETNAEGLQSPTRYKRQQSRNCALDEQVCERTNGPYAS